MPVAPSIDDILADDNLTSDQTLLLIAISRHAHADGTGAYPSLRRLAALTKFSLSHICTLLQALEQTGALTIERFKGPKGVNAYTLHVPQVLRSTEHRHQVRVRKELRSDESEVQAEEKNPVRVQEEELHTGVLRSPEQYEAVGTLTPAAARWLHINATPGGIASQSCGIETLPPSETVAANTPSDIVRTATESTPPGAARPRKPRGEGLYKLGKLCKRGHDHEGRGKSLRRLPSGSCLQCDLERQEAKRRDKVRANREARGPRRIVNLDAYRTSQGT